MSNLASVEVIAARILEIRNKKVMLDRDLVILGRDGIFKVTNCDLEQN